MNIINLFRDTFKAWSADKASRLGAALAYYTIFSIGPLLLVIIGIAGLVFGPAAAKGQIEGTLRNVVGNGASAIQSILENSSKTSSGIIATVIGTVTLLMGAAGIFGQLQDALNTVWGVMPKPAGIGEMILRRILTFIMVLGIGLLLLASLAASALLSTLASYLGGILPGGTIVWQILNYVVSAAVIMLAFALIYKVLPDAKFGWNVVWIGAAVTTVLFIVGQLALSLYLGFSNVGSPYGAASSLVVVLVWIYYTAQIVLFGAEFTKVYADSIGHSVEPKPHAQWIEGHARASQGLKPKEKPRKSPAARMPRVPSPWFK